MRAVLALELRQAGRLASHYGPGALRLAAEAAAVLAFVAAIGAVAIGAASADTPPRPSVMLAETIR